MATPKKPKNKKEQISKADLLLFSKMVGGLKKEIADFKKDYPVALASQSQKQPAGPTLDQVLKGSPPPPAQLFSFIPKDVVFKTEIGVGLPPSLLPPKKIMNEFTVALGRLMMQYKVSEVVACFLKRLH